MLTKIERIGIFCLRLRKDPAVTAQNRASALLTRDEFSERVFARCRGLCCVPDCGLAAVDPHHIIERRLWPDGGYYLANGAPLCSEHHLQAEFTTLSPEQLWEWCGVIQRVLPPQFEDGEAIDKWGNPVLPNGTRLRGELFFDEAVQKALRNGGVLPRFTHWVKYPKTYHCPTSPGVTKDDRVLATMGHFVGQRVIVTEKRDGECSSLYRDHMHARSLDSRHHPSRNWLKSFQAAVGPDLPEYWRVVGEGMCAVHSIRYAALPSWFEGFSIWDERNRCLSWDETLEWFAMLGSSSGVSITPVPTLYDGIYDPVAIAESWQSLLSRDQAEARRTGDPVQEREGFVIRTAADFAYKDFRTSVCKWVRKGHVQTDQHWMQKEVEHNGRIEQQEMDRC